MGGAVKAGGRMFHNKAAIMLDKLPRRNTKNVITQTRRGMKIIPNRNQKSMGLTLMELMCVILIVAIMAAL